MCAATSTPNLSPAQGIAQGRLLELVKLIVQVLDDVLHLNRGKL
jgi:hypothetical protein